MKETSQEPPVRDDPGPSSCAARARCPHPAASAHRCTAQVTALPPHQGACHTPPFPPPPPSDSRLLPFLPAHQNPYAAWVQGRGGGADRRGRGDGVPAAAETRPARPSAGESPPPSPFRPPTAGDTPPWNFQASPVHRLWPRAGRRGRGAGSGGPTARPAPPAAALPPHPLTTTSGLPPSPPPLQCPPPRWGLPPAPSALLVAPAAAAGPAAAGGSADSIAPAFHVLINQELRQSSYTSPSIFVETSRMNNTKVL